MQMQYNAVPAQLLSANRAHTAACYSEARGMYTQMLEIPEHRATCHNQHCIQRVVTPPMGAPALMCLHTAYA
jgi:hypothetical protein